MIPLAIPDLTGNESNYLQECIESTYVSSVGPFVDRFEKAVAEAAGSAHAVATSSGTAALHVALASVGVGQDDLVIVPSLTFIASANAISYCGAIPWLIDVEPGSWNLDATLLEEVLQAETEQRGNPRGIFLIHKKTDRRVAAIMPVYTLGLPANMRAIASVAGIYGVPVVADAAAALGSAVYGRPVGALGADLTAFSFNGNKTVTSGGGGAVVGENLEQLQLVRHLSTTARVGDAYDHDRIGFNYRMTNIQAAVGCAQLERLEQFIIAKRRIRAQYEAAFQGYEQLGNYPTPQGYHSACWFSGALVDGLDQAGMTELVARLRQEGVGAKPFWKPIHLQTPYLKAMKSQQPVCESLWYRILTLPCSTGLSQEDQAYVISVVKKIFDGV